jgi:Ca2+-transporting ATPase
MVFMTLTLAQLGHAMAVRSHGASLFAIGIRGNPLMLGALVVTLVLQLGVVYVPAGQRFFGTVPLTGAELLLCLVASSAIFWAGEKWLVRRAQVA